MLWPCEELAKNADNYFRLLDNNFRDRMNVECDVNIEEGAPLVNIKQEPSENENPLKIKDEPPDEETDVPENANPEMYWANKLFMKRIKQEVIC